MADLSKIKLNGTTYNFKDAQARADIANLGSPPLATQSTPGLMSANDKQTLDNLNPNVSVTISNLNQEETYIINAKQENLVNLEIIEQPHILSQVRTNNLLNVNAELENAYINGSGVITPSGAAGTDRLGPWIEVSPGQDIYYTGTTNPNAGSNQNFNRRLHAFKSDKTWIKQVNYVSVKGPNVTWSVHGVLPANTAYVRFSWNEGDYNIMATVGAPSGYEPYYITPFEAITSASFQIANNAEFNNAVTYTTNVPAAAGDVYSFTYNPVLGKIYVGTGHITSYNGETLPGAWISDRDIYDANSTPSTGAEVIYDLASPIEYDITPADIPLFYHINYFLVDNGLISTFTYYAETLAVSHITIRNGATFGETDFFESDVIAWKETVDLMDTKANIESPIFTGSPTAPTPALNANSTRIATTQFVQSIMNNIAKVEPTNKASQNYATGDYLMYGGQLYKVTDTIAQNTTIEVGTNVSATTVTDELKQLLSLIS